MLSFSEALVAAKQGKKISRKGWNGKGMYLYLVETELPVWFGTEPGKTDEDWKHPYGESNFIVMKTADNRLIPWLASQTDILTEDWGIVE